MQRKRPKNIAIFSTKLEKFFKKEEEINIFNLFILNYPLLFNFKIAGEKNQNAKLLAIFFEKIK